MRYSQLSKAESLEEAFCEAMDQEGPVVIMGIEFDRSAILKEMDPIAYDTELANFFDAMGFDPDEDDEPDVSEAQEWESFDADC
jgi:hypothetical protein